jgi:thiosulfate dehydrogenase [quinone] large subunit
MSIADNFKQTTALGYVALVRILVGIQFFIVAWPKVSGGRFLGSGGRALAGQLMQGAAKDSFAWHRAFIEGFVIPHANVFSYIVAFGELAIALSLIFGCLVRVSSLFGAFHNFNIYYSLGIAAGGATMNYNRLLILLHLVFVCTAAGRALGLDAFLHKRFPRSPLF